MGATTRSQQPDRFTHLLADIRSGLGDNWTFYEECIEGVLDAAARQQDTTAWFEQMQQVVEDIDELRLSHEGLLFLLRDMGIHTPEAQSRGEGESALGTYHSSLLSPTGKCSKLPAWSTNFHNNNDKNMASEPVRPPSSMNPPPLRPLRPSTPAIADWPPPRAPTPVTHRNNQQQKQKQKRNQQPQQQTPNQPTSVAKNVEPLDDSAAVLPGLTFPENLRDYHCPRDEIIMTENYLPPPPNPLRVASDDPVFFSNPALKADIAELFGRTVERNEHGQHSHSTWKVPSALPYDPEDDDLMVWKARAEGGTEEEHIKMNEGFDTLPPWNGRFDLEI